MTESQTTPIALEDEPSFDAFVADHEIALVECVTVGCPMCQAMEPVLGNVARETGVPVGVVDLGDVPDLVERLEITSVPTLLLVENATEIARVADGFLGGDEVVDFLASNVPDVVASET